MRNLPKSRALRSDEKVILLLGFMGSGKSKAGKKLSRLLGRRFIDLDGCVEKRARRTVSDIFQKEGEGSFRQKERACLAEVLSHGSRCVVAVGGGAPAYRDNMARMNEAGTTVYLRLTPAKLHQRLLHDKSPRPLIRYLGREELLPFIRTLLKSRKHYYEQAQIIVDAARTPEAVARNVAALLTSTRKENCQNSRSRSHPRR